MATYGTDLTTLANADDDTVETTWTELAAPYALGGSPADDDENLIQGTNCQSQTTGTKSGLVFSIVFDAGSDQSGNFASDGSDVVLIWSYYAVVANLETFANGGRRAVIASDTSNGDAYKVGGSDDPYASGWKNVAVDPNKTADYTIGSGNAGSWRYFGMMPYTLAAISKGTPHAVDAIRYGRGEIYCTGTGCDFTGMAQYNDYNDSTNGYNRFGLFQYNSDTGVYLWKGLMSIGQTGTSATFSDSNKNINIDDTPAAQATFNRIEVNNASTSLTWTNISFTALGSTSPGDFIMNDNATVTKAGCTFNSMGTFTYLSNASVTGGTYNSCAQIDSGGGTFNRTKVYTSTVAADSSAFVWNSATDPDGYMDDMEFSKGTNDHHAIEFGTSSPTTINLNGIDFDGFDGADSQNDSVFYIARTGGTVTINLSGCTFTGPSNAAPSYKSAGATVVINQDQVSHTLTGLVNASEVTYVKRGTADDTGSDGSTTTDSRNFVTTNSWITDEHQGKLLYITSGSDTGRYYVSGNNATTLYLDTEMTATASSLTWELYDENNDTIVYHVESVTGNQTQYTYTYVSDVTVDILIIHVNYEQIVLEDIVLGNTSQSLPQTQISDVNYYNP
jgi:hypothetical protein